MKLNRKRIFISISVAILVIALLGFFYLRSLNYEKIIEAEISGFLSEKQIKLNKISVAKFSTNNLQITEFDVGDKERINISNLNMDYQLNELLKSQDVSGKFRSPKLIVTTDKLEIPALKLSGDFHLHNKDFAAFMQFEDSSKKWLLKAKISAVLGDEKSGAVALEQLKFPYLDGKISMQNITIPFVQKKRIAAKIRLENIDLEQLMQKISDGKVSGTGKISGNIPIYITPDGKIEFGEGELTNQQNGIISVAPELLAGDSAQMQITRTALENFNYTILKIGLSSVNNQLQVKLAVQGNNPNAFDGQQINLNVNLSGDVLPLIQQSIMPINDIKKLLDEAQ